MLEQSSDPRETAGAEIHPAADRPPPLAVAQAALAACPRTPEHLPRSIRPEFGEALLRWLDLFVKDLREAHQENRAPFPYPVLLVAPALVLAQPAPATAIAERLVLVEAGRWGDLLALVERQRASGRASQPRSPQLRARALFEDDAVSRGLRALAAIDKKF
jgi:hypothetical protein